MQTRVQKWGNSLAVRIPATFSQECHLTPGAKVDISVDKGQVVISPSRNKLELKDLLNAITDENKHDAVEFGSAMGKEIIDD